MKRIILIFGLFVIFVLVFSNGYQYAQTVPNPNSGNNNRNGVEQTIDRILSEYYQEHQYPGGISLAITRNERLVYTGAVGYADRNNTVRLTPQHRMRLASVSKAITSIAISKLYEEGKLSFDDKVFGTDGIFKNAIGMPTYNGNPVDMTVRQILEHRTGFRRDIESSGRWNFVVDRNAIATPLDFLPGAEYRYSNFAYNILGRIIETVTGMPYEKYVQEHVLQLCGITGMRVGTDAPGPDEVEYIRYDAITTMPPNAPGPSGGWIANPIELIKFLSHIDNFPNVPDILRSDTPRINALRHGGMMQGTWTFLQRDSDGFNWTLLLNYAPPNYEELDLSALFRQIKNAIREWPVGADLSGVSDGITFVRTPYHDFYFDLLSYRTATGNIEIVVNEDFTLSQLTTIEAPWKAGATLTIRSANPARPVTITRGVSGNMFTVHNGATLIFRDIIIDGGNRGAFAENGGGALVWVNGGSFIMNAGAVLRNNTNTTTSHPGGGVFTYGTATFTMNGGLITGNSAVSYGGGVYTYGTGSFTMTGGEISGNNAPWGGGIFNSGSVSFIMNGGKISTNTAANTGGGVFVNGATSLTPSFTMTGGEISGNTASSSNGVRVNANGIFNQYGGVVAGTGRNTSVIVSSASSSGHNTNGAPNNAVTIAWNRPAGILNYTVGSGTDLTVSSGARATWANQGGLLGISYNRGTNRGWIRAW